ncbi:hypothetical protein [Streptococcus hyointestinalis]|uniref:hypothetical protein n=1 Tax=Streptococcus hyointestinalis TaxID=1337 RepID=UPI003D0047D6
MANLLVKTAETVTTKKIAFPTFKVDDSARKIAKKVATYMGKVRAASKVEHSEVSIGDIFRLVKSASEKVLVKKCVALFVSRLLMLYLKNTKNILLISFQVRQTLIKW